MSFGSTLRILRSFQKLRTDDCRFEDVVHSRRMYCDGACRKFFTFESPCFGGAGAYAFVPEEIIHCSSWLEAIAILEKLYKSHRWNATWFCATCWQAMYLQQDELVLTIGDVRGRLRVVNERFDEIMKRVI